MDLLYGIFIDPFVQMVQVPDLFVQTLWEGLVSGVLYALIALGFVLIFKASGVFNFAQGAMVLFAALAMARFSEWIPKLLGVDSRLLANVVAFAAADVGMRRGGFGRLRRFERWRRQRIGGRLGGHGGDHRRLLDAFLNRSNRPHHRALPAVGRILNVL